MKDRKNVVALLGGLGNQLFQAAFARWLEELTGYPTLFDVSFRRRDRLDILAVPGIGDAVRARIVRVTRYMPTPDGRLPRLGRLVRKVWRPGCIVRDYTSCGAGAIDVSCPAWWFGYWQRIQYTERLLAEMAAAMDCCSVSPDEDSIAIHVRRGDMLATVSRTPETWFAEALAHLLDAEPRLRGAAVHVWSDDPHWCRVSLDLGAPFVLVTSQGPVEDLAAMSRCSALVISRSTFAWWAARLAALRGASVVFPAPWTPGSGQRDSLIVPADWCSVPAPSPGQPAPRTGAGPNELSQVS